MEFQYKFIKEEIESRIQEYDADILRFNYCLKNIFDRANNKPNKDAYDEMKRISKKHFFVSRLSKIVESYSEGFVE